MNEMNCGCCEGIEKQTPQAVENRPGLSALRYRVGTYGTFLETMLASMSNRNYPALDNLKTRETGDPAIALLDAGAVIFDVLTFYQERIANEGYLRTATERRSILELARLIGYKLRPGVAASAFLAFTLENGYETEIPVGTRAQSIPGPGELPQAFETSEPLLARSDWNALKPRMSRPQSIHLEGKGVDKTTVYFAGTSTNINPNDPLLFVFAVNQTEIPVLCKVESVEAQNADHRTKVVLLPQKVASLGAVTNVRASQPRMNVGAAPAAVAMQLKSVVEKYTDPQAFGVSPGSARAHDLVALLEEFSNSLGSEATLITLITTLDKLLQRLRELHEAFENRGWTNLVRWVGELIAALDEIRNGLPHIGLNAEASSEAGDSDSPAPSGNGQNGKGISAFGKLGAILNPLSKRPSQQPANASKLDRSIKTLYGARADILPRFLTAFNPKLKEVLYKAWSNVTVRSAPNVQEPVLKNVYVLRVKAAPFGHNAPLRPDHFDEGRNMIVYDEWEIHDPLNQKAVPLSADFMACPSSGEAPLAVQFIDRSAGNASKWAWDFGDDSTSDVRDPQHMFSAPGTYSVVLTVSYLSDSKSITKTVTVTEAAAISAAFTADRVRGLTPLTVTFTDHSSGEINEWLWDFGDGQMSSQQSTTHTFSPSGTYTVTLTVKGAQGESTASAIIIAEPNIGFLASVESNVVQAAAAPAGPAHHQSNFIYLDSDYTVLPDSWVVIEPGLEDPTIVKLGQDAVTQQSLAAYGLTGKSTGLNLGSKKWFDDIASEPFNTVRGTTVYVQSEVLVLAEEPIMAVDASTGEVKLQPVDGNEIEVVALYNRLESGRWGIVSGERSDIKDDAGYTVPGVFDSELVMLAGVDQRYDPNLPGDTPHTVLTFAVPLAYTYKRETVIIYGNVVKSTHGETRREVLGSGDASKEFQAFPLKQSPLTFVSSPTPSGVESTLEVRVNDILWPEVDGLVWLGENDRGYETKTDDDSKTTVIFGDGQHGTRLSTGTENVRATYRFGIGKLGNVRARQVSLLATKPLGVKSVINPLPATGGADREDRDLARENAPLAVMALDRLVSVQDYAEFARTFAGVGKASAVRLSDGRRELVHVSIAGVDNIPIVETSDLFRNLRLAFSRFNGDPFQPVMLAIRSLKLLVIVASVKLLAEYEWESVEPKIRQALLDVFSFARRGLGEDVVSSQVISTIQSVAGVAYVDLDVLDTVDEDSDLSDLENLANTLVLRDRIPVYLARLDTSTNTLPRSILPAQLCFLNPEIPDVLILKELPQ